MTTIRTPAVAGAFYPAQADELRAALTAYLRGAHAPAPPPMGPGAACAAEADVERDKLQHRVPGTPRGDHTLWRGPPRTDDL